MRAPPICAASSRAWLAGLLRGTCGHTKHSQPRSHPVPRLLRRKFSPAASSLCASGPVSPSQSDGMRGAVPIREGPKVRSKRAESAGIRPFRRLSVEVSAGNQMDRMDIVERIHMHPFSDQSRQTQPLTRPRIPSHPICSQSAAQHSTAHLTSPAAAQEILPASSQCRRIPTRAPASQTANILHRGCSGTPHRQPPLPPCFIPCVVSARLGRIPVSA